MPSILPSNRQPVLSANLGEDKGDAGVLGTVFDLLSRPSRAIAEGTKRVVVDKKGLDEFLKGIGAGLAGKASVGGFGDVLAASSGRESPNRLQSLLGFVGDVALDPLTYTSAGVSRGITRDAASTEALRIASKSGQEVTDEAVNAISRRLRDDSPTHFYVRFGVGKYGLEAKSQRIAETGDRLLEAITTRPTGTTGVRETKNLAKAFSRKAELPGGIDRIVRLQEMNSAARAQEIGALKDLGNLLSPEDSRAVVEAMDSGNLTGLKAITLPKNPYGLRDASDLAKIYRDTLDRWWDDEVSLGLRDPKAKSVDYVPRYLNGNEKNIEKIGKGEKAIRIPSPNKNTPTTKLAASQVPFDELIKYGFDPDMDIRSIMAQRGAKHIGMVSRAKMIDDSINHLKIDFNPANKNYLYRHDFVPVENIDHSVARRYKGSYMPREAVEALNRLNRFFDSDETAAKVIKQYDHALSEWKFLATATPMTRARNAMSDFIMGAQDGVLPARGYYTKARKVLQGIDDRNIYDLLGRPAPKAVNNIEIRGLRTNANDVWKLFTESGGKAGFVSSELYRDLAPLNKGIIADVTSRYGRDLPDAVEGALGKSRELYGKAKQKTGEWADKQEDFFRMAHFVKRMEDELPKKFRKGNLDITNPEVRQAAERANDLVRKYHLDYGNLTQFEKRYARRVVPFYSFMRQAIPQQVEMLFTRPGFMALYPKGANLLQGALFGEGPDEDPLVPQWIRELAPFQVASGKQTNSVQGKILRTLFGGAPGDKYVATLTGTPAEVLNRLQPVVNTLGAAREGRLPGLNESLGAASKEFLGTTSPFLKAPVELGTGRNVFTGQDISEQGWMQWLGSQLPTSRILQQGGIEREGLGQAGIGRWLTGADIRPIGSGQRKGEAFRQLDELTNEYEKHSKKTPEGDRMPVDARGRTLKQQIAELQKFVQSGRPRTSQGKPTQVTLR